MSGNRRTLTDEGEWSGEEHKLNPFSRQSIRRFYAPLAIVRGLSNHYNDKSEYISHEPDFDEEGSDDGSPRAMFQRFVYSLAKVCDKKKGGDTVTAFAVLADHNRPVYIFASNHVSASVRRDGVEAHVKRILSELEKGDVNFPAGRVELKDKLMWIVLEYNRARVQEYMAKLKASVGKCLASLSSTRDGLANATLEQALCAMGDTLDGQDLTTPDVKRYVESYAKCLNGLDNFTTRGTGAYWVVKDKIAHIQQHDGTSSECWYELRHFISRLIAYDGAARVFIQARCCWPELFKSFTVESLPSSKEDHKITQTLQEMTLADAEVIYGSRPTGEKEFRAMVTELSRFELERRFTVVCKGECRSVRVHAEVLVHNYITRQGGLKFRRWFKNWQYIGSSKPTCRLCSYYFTGTPVATRPSHGNLYPNWRFPDVYEGDSKAAIHRQNKANAMVKALMDAARVMVEMKKPAGKTHDSNTYTVSGQFARDLALCEEEWEASTQARDSESW